MKTGTGFYTEAVESNDRVRRHKLVTKELLAATPALYSTEETPLDEKVVTFKVFNPYGPGVWYVTELDPETGIAFGWAEIIPGFGEWGYFSLNELGKVKVPPFNLPLERDKYWTPKPWKEVQS